MEQHPAILGSTTETDNKKTFFDPQNGGENSLMSMSMDPAALSARLAPVYQPSPVMGRRSLDRQRSMSPRSMRKYNSTARLELGHDGSPPGSPSSAAHYRRSNSREESSASAGKNVFSRLIAGTNIGERQGSNKGVINPYQGRIGGKSPLICSSVAEGHNRPVLSVFATEDLLFSASKDQTVKASKIILKGGVIT